MAIFVDDAERVFLRQRPGAGIWGGLWGFPEFENEALLLEKVQDCGGSKADINIWPPITHGFSHFQLKITPVRVRLPAEACRIMDEADGRWIDPIALPKLGLAAPVTRLLQKLAEQQAMPA